MTPAARLQMAIEILDGLEQTAQPPDRFLKAWFRTRRFAGSKDRRAIAEQVFSVQRHRAHLAHRLGGDTPRALVIASLLETHEDAAALFSGGYGPAPLTDAERAAMAAAPQTRTGLGDRRISPMAGARTDPRRWRSFTPREGGIAPARAHRLACQHCEGRA